MVTREHDRTKVAYDYAWWLTGDDAKAAHAVRTINGAHELPDVLASIRATAIDERTMCPASELALLHDRAQLPLDQAAQIAVIDPAEARTELAHGRLEALEVTVDGSFVHPERLGGLAVGNPADVAHARTCDDCARALEALREGRAALEAIPLHVPDGLEELAEAGVPADDGAGMALPVAGPDAEDDEDAGPVAVPAWAWLLVIAMAAAAGTGVYLGWP